MLWSMFGHATSFNQWVFFFKLNNSDQISPLLMMLIVNINVLPYFENRNKYALHNIFEETGSKLRRWSKLGLFFNKCLRLQTWRTSSRVLFSSLRSCEASFCRMRAMLYRMTVSLTNKKINVRLWKHEKPVDHNPQKAVSRIRNNLFRVRTDPRTGTRTKDDLTDLQQDLLLKKDWTLGLKQGQNKRWPNPKKWPDPTEPGSTTSNQSHAALRWGMKTQIHSFIVKLYISPDFLNDNPAIKGTGTKSGCSKSPGYYPITYKCPREIFIWALKLSYFSHFLTHSTVLEKGWNVTKTTRV
jgi:hypothetical protein